MAKRARNQAETAAGGEIEFYVSSGNVYADLGFEDPERELAKAKLSLQIARIIKERGLTQVAAGEVLGIAQSDVSKIARGLLGDYSLEYLMNLLTRFDQEVLIIVRPVAPGTGRYTALVAD